MKIVILDGYSVNPGDLDWNALQAMGELAIYDRTAPADIVERCCGAEIVLTNKVPFTAETITRLPDLRYFSMPSTSPANASFSMTRLAERWKAMFDFGSVACPPI